MVNGLWGDWSPEGTFDVEPKNTDCNQPPTITSLTADPEWVPSGRKLTVTVVASDPENDPLTCTWSKNRGTLSSTTSCNSVTWTAPSGSGHAAITVSVTDNKEGHSPIVWSRQVSYGCTYTINPTSASYSASGGFGSVEVTAPSGCPWSVTFDAPWLYPAPVVAVNKTGNGTVHYQVEASSSAQSRTGTITIAEQTFTVTQEAAPCAYEINPTGAAILCVRWKWNRKRNNK